MSADAAQKLRRMVELCDAFRLPIVSLVDEPGFAIGADAERAATIRHGMAAMFAALQTTVPWAALVLRRAFGVAAGTLGPAPTVFAWPSAQIGALPSRRRRARLPAKFEPRRRRARAELEAGSRRRSRSSARGRLRRARADRSARRAHACEWTLEISPSSPDSDSRRARVIRRAS
jgi:acetyl-CoA carboxylase carboxyltransferase component